MTRIIGLAGRKRSGKDTTAGMLIGFTRVALADKVREYLYVLDPIIASFSLPNGACQVVRLQEVVDEYGWDYAKVEYPEARTLQQKMGTELGRQLLGANFWIDRAAEEIAKRDLSDVVITDIRFQNEVDWIHSRGGIVARLSRPSAIDADAHDSEVGVDNLRGIDVEIDNSGTFMFLEQQVKNLYYTAQNIWAARGML